MGALTLSKSLPRFFRSGIKEPLDDTRKVVVKFTKSDIYIELVPVNST